MPTFPISRFGLLLAALTLPTSAFAQKAPPPKPTNGTIAFAIAGSGGTATGEFKACLTVEKAGKTTLKNGAPAAGENAVDGNHNFPTHATAGGIGAYYQGILANAGYTDPADFTVDGGVINFYGIDKIDGGCNKGGVKCGGATDSPKTHPFGEINPKAGNRKADLKASDSTAGDIKVVQMQRPGRGMDGSLTLVAFGILWNADQTFETATSTVTVHFSATDSAYTAMAKVRDALLRAGWEAALTADAQLLITRNGRGAQVASLYHEISYFPSGSFTENDDHWVFWAGSLSDVDADGDGVIDS